MKADITVLTQLKEVRRSRKIKVQDLAKEIGVSREYMGQMETGKVMPRFDVVQNWASILGYQIVIAIK